MDAARSPPADDRADIVPGVLGERCKTEGRCGLGRGRSGQFPVGNNYDLSRLQRFADGKAVEAHDLSRIAFEFLGDALERIAPLHFILHTRDRQNNQLISDFYHARTPEIVRPKECLQRDAKPLGNGARRISRLDRVDQNLVGRGPRNRPQRVSGRYQRVFLGGRERHILLNRTPDRKGQLELAAQKRHGKLGGRGFNYGFRG